MQIYYSEKYGSLYYLEDDELIQVPLAKGVMDLDNEGGSVNWNCISEEEVIDLKRIQEVLMI